MVILSVTSYESSMKYPSAGSIMWSVCTDVVQAGYQEPGIDAEQWLNILKVNVQKLVKLPDR